MGRPVGTGTGNTKLIQVRVTPAQYQHLTMLARAHNTTITDIVRKRISELVTATAGLQETAA